MEISNPIASQYVVNQGLTSQLNDQGKQLPIKSEQFLQEQKKLKTDSEQKLNSENTPSKNNDKNTNKLTDSENANQVTDATQLLQTNPTINFNLQKDSSPTANNELATPDISNNAAKLNTIAKTNTPIQKYQETSNMNIASSLNNIDFYT